MNPIKNIIKKLANAIRYYIFSFNGLGLIKYSPIHKILYFFWSHFVPEYVEIEGHKIYLDPKDSLGLSINANYEENEIKLIKKIIRKDSIVIDIGANIGYFTLIFAKLVGPNGRVYAFEPDPTNFSILKKNIQINGYKNVILTQKAASDKNELIKLFLCKFSNGMHRIYESELCDDSIDIESTTLDEFFSSINFDQEISFIKIDTEGSEIKVLRGMEKTLIKNNNISILVEFEPGSIVQAKEEPKSLPEFLIKKGFRIMTFESSSNDLQPIDMHVLLDKYSEKKMTNVNLFCTKNKTFC